LAWPFGILIDERDRIVVVGEGVSADHRSNWTVRVSEDCGDSWSVVDDFRLSSSGAVAFDIARSSRGSLYVVGDAKDESFARNWLVRKMACP
jgi:hypothetical protein